VNLGRQRSPKNVSKNYPTKYIRAANITENGLSLTDILDMEFTPKEKGKYILKHGDIVVSEASGSITQVGKPAIWEGQLSECCFQNTVIRLRLYNDRPRYVYWYLKYLYVNGYYSRIVGGVGINHIGAGNFSNIEIDIAPISEQDRIVNQIESRLSVCDSIEKTIDTALQEAEALRQSILKQAFEGGL
jgi:type I restriction enzyme S subunit